MKQAERGILTQKKKPGAFHSRRGRIWPWPFTPTHTCYTYMCVRACRHYRVTWHHSPHGFVLITNAGIPANETRQRYLCMGKWWESFVSIREDKALAPPCTEGQWRESSWRNPARRMSEQGSIDPSSHWKWDVFFFFFLFCRNFSHLTHVLSPHVCVQP